MTLPGILLWLSFIYLEVRRNYHIIEVLKERPNYLRSFMVRSFAGLGCLWIMYPDFAPLWNWWSVLGAVPFVVFEISSFYLVFDPWLNKKRGRKWYYKGENSGILDGLPMWAYYLLKLLCLIALPLSIIAILK